MTTQLALGDVTLDVNFKDIKNVHLSVHPPHGRITISAPKRMSMDIIRVFAITKMGWIKRQQRKLQEQERETPREYIDGESHFVWGSRYLLKLAKSDDGNTIVLGHRHLTMRLKLENTVDKRAAILAEWYREQIKLLAPAIVTKWEPILGVRVNKLGVQKMKTKWGSCNQRSSSILLNTELAKKPKECLEYVLVHEMAHLIEPTHNKRFAAVMNRVMPNWRLRRNMLNELPLSRQEWKS